jgi:hypothetical protein
MRPKLKKCSLVVRRLKPGGGVEESSLEVENLEQLLERCVSLAGEQLVERLVVEGSDREGRRRALNFTFQSDSERG